MKVTVVDHGNVFNTGHWYTFYCPHCNKQITRNDSEEKCCYCNENIEWEKSE